MDKIITEKRFPWNGDSTVEYAYSLDNFRIIKTHAKNNNAIIFFAGNGIYSPNEYDIFKKAIIDNDRFEWENIAQDYNLRKTYSLIILIRDIYKQWYLDGINNKINTQDKVIEKLKELTKGYKVTTAGNSAGGYMAILAGCKIDAQRIFTFSGQFTLKDGYGPIVDKNMDTQKNKYYSLIPLLNSTKSKIYYFYPVNCQQDIEEYELIKNQNSIFVFCFDSEKHGVTFEYRCYKTILSQNDEIIQKLYYKYKNKIINPKEFTKDLHKCLSIKYKITRFLQFIFFIEKYHSMNIIKILGIKIKIKKKAKQWIKI